MPVIIMEPNMPGYANIPDAPRLIRLLQLASPTLPVGAYSYSEGLEYAVHAGVVDDAVKLRAWLSDGLCHGAAQLEAAVLVRVYDAKHTGEVERIRYWDRWLTAARESEELREQSLDMGRALIRLYRELVDSPWEDMPFSGERCNFVTAFALVAAQDGIPCTAAVTAYLQTWVANLVGAGVKLIPLGQTAGQRLLWELQASIEHAANLAFDVADDEMGVSNWGLVLASMAHETQYTRLFRS